MLITQAYRPPEQRIQAPPTFLQRRRLPLLCLLLALAVGWNVMLAKTAPPVDSDPTLFTSAWLLAFLPYLAACALILKTRGPEGRRQRLEVALVLAGALLLRAMLLFIPPDLSHDSWRYLWDARVTLHGYSPYVYAPGDPALLPLRDFLYSVIRFRNVPTLYPPGAQAFYLLSYLLAPENLFFFKGLLLVCELVSCGALAWLLHRRGTDPARCLLYAWCPLPIVEFAIQGHIDALTVTLMLLTMVCAQSKRRGMRVLTGFLLALATLTKIYPILLLAVVLRKKDWALLGTCILTLLLAYLPYLILGHGQILGFFATYASEHTPNAGVVPQVTGWLAGLAGLNARLAQGLTYLLDLLIVGGTALLVWRLRLRERVSMEAGLLILIGAVFAVSSHIFPWYTPALLPWVALSIKPRFQRGAAGANAGGIALAAAWYFACATILSYFFTYTIDWHLYYILVYDLVIAALAAAALIAIVQRTTHARREEAWRDG